MNICFTSHYGNEFRLWEKDRIQEYLRIKALPTTGNKDELFDASYFCIELKM